MASKEEFLPGDVPITNVVVYRDRAEITRILRMKPGSVGQQEVVLAGIPTPVDLASLRVVGRGPAVVTEVKLSELFVDKTQHSATDQKKKGLRQAIESLKQQGIREENEEANLVNQRKFWNTTLESLSKGAFGVRDEKSFAATPESFESLSGVLEVHAKKIKELDQLLREKREVLKKLTEEVTTAERNLNEFTSSCERRSWTIVVGLDVTVEDSELELTISYIVFNARWSPKYDVRVSAEEKKLAISYYGIVTQNTGEDWIDVPLSLSTALPSFGGAIPVLGTKQVSFKVPYEAQYSDQHCDQTAFGGFQRPLPKMQVALFGASSASSNAPMPMQQRVAQVIQDSGITTSFEIVKPTTVPSDGSEHKVTIGIIDLKPEIQYKCIPKKVEQAFLEAKAVNSSQYPILPGPASVFFGSNFVATVDLKTVSPQEEFTCSLGVDPAVKITYRPVRRFTEQTGLLSKSSVVTYVQEIEVNNTRSDSVHVVVIDQIPCSTEDKLKVTIIDPPLTKEKPELKGLKLNKENNIEHEVDVKEGSKYIWTIKYKMEFPSDKEIRELELPGSC